MADSETQLAGGNDGDKPDGLGVKVVSIPTAKRGRGRPPGSTTKPKPASVEKPGEVVAQLDPGLIGDLFVNLAEIGDDVFLLVILNRAKTKLNPDNFTKFRAEMETIRLRGTDKKLIHDAGVALARKYTFLLVWGPEIILLVCAVQYAARMGNVLRKVNALPDLPKASPVEVSDDRQKAG